MKIEPMTPDKWRLIDVRLHNRYRSLADMCENVQIYVGEHTYAVFDGYLLILSSPKQEKSDHITLLFLLENNYTDRRSNGV